MQLLFLIGLDVYTLDDSHAYSMMHANNGEILELSDLCHFCCVDDHRKRHYVP